MNRKFLEDLNIDKEIIDKILAENSSDIAKIESERDEIKSKLDNTVSDLAKKDSEYQAKLADMEFRSILDTVITSSKAKNLKAVKALLDVESLKSSKNQSEDIKAAIEKVKSENDYLFDGTSIPGGGANPPIDTNSKANPLPKGTVIF